MELWQVLLLMYVWGLFIFTVLIIDRARTVLIIERARGRVERGAELLAVLLLTIFYPLSIVSIMFAEIRKAVKSKSYTKVSK